ncbi:hypothetical protein D8Y22_12865 [Salinadaptatus halalkaliphilus]|uniref:PhiH1 repressor n=1 Tax=Salinadaptatus halalkaliphilus TaxID=2419781 RepID=A0A4S3TPK8_9EURY|nr:hypothetical protein [Salinadaptatus halalkaliphilus]THE64528.1 hypothetical protein D8Y22_12865 [Salinadaptatus halalkaliphilus]
MRERAQWMKPTDDAILEYVRDAREVPPAVIGRNIDSHPNYVGQRCRILSENGLLNRAEDGYYSLTELGKRYLDEEIDPDELEIDED